MPDHILNPGDLALIIGAKGSFELLGQCAQVHDLVTGIGPVAFRGRIYTKTSPGPAAFIELRDGSLWLWSLANLMPLRGDAAERSWRKREVSHG